MSLSLNRTVIIISGSIAVLAIATTVICSITVCDKKSCQSTNNTVNQEINSQFIEFKEIKEKLPQKPEEVSLVAVGDIMLSRVVDSKMRKYGMDYPFLQTREYLKTGDIVFGNLETPITPGRQIFTGEMTFRSDPGVENELVEAGFSIVSLANNHTPNFG
ncbi:unnamed protein product, partial [marine sediment metagenome]